MKPAIRRAAAILALTSLLAACTAMPPAPDQPGLNGTVWVLSALPGQSLLPDATVTARFEGARVQGTDGCNRYSAPYTETGSTLQVGPRGASTQMACPPAVMKQAEAFMGALTRASTYRVADGRLQLLAADGTALATLAPQPQSLSGTSWRVTGYNNGKQAVVSVLAGAEITAAFSEDGKLSGSAGCNTYNTSFTTDGSSIQIGPAATTRMMCQTPEGVIEQEAAYLSAIQTAASYQLQGNSLTLKDADGSTLAQYTRK